MKRFGAALAITGLVAAGSGTALAAPKQKSAKKSQAVRLSADEMDRVVAGRAAGSVVHWVPGQSTTNEVGDKDTNGNHNYRRADSSNATCIDDAPGGCG
jgi:hypothetical protein